MEASLSFEKVTKHCESQFEWLLQEKEVLWLSYMNWSQYLDGRGPRELANIQIDQGCSYSGSLETAFLTILLQKWWKETSGNQGKLFVFEIEKSETEKASTVSTEIGEKIIEHSRVTTVLSQRYSYEATLWIFLPLFPFPILEVNDVTNDFLAHTLLSFSSINTSVTALFSTEFLGVLFVLLFSVCFLMLKEGN